MDFLIQERLSSFIFAQNRKFRGQFSNFCLCYLAGKFVSLLNVLNIFSNEIEDKIGFLCLVKLERKNDNRDVENPNSSCNVIFRNLLVNDKYNNRNINSISCTSSTKLNIIKWWSYNHPKLNSNYRKNIFNNSISLSLEYFNYSLGSNYKDSLFTVSLKIYS